MPQYEVKISVSNNDLFKLWAMREKFNVRTKGGKTETRYHESVLDYTGRDTKFLEQMAGKGIVYEVVSDWGAQETTFFISSVGIEVLKQYVQQSGLK